MAKQFRLNILPKCGDIVHYHVAHLPYYKINDIDMVHKVLKKAYNRPKEFSMARQIAGMYPDLAVVTWWSHVNI